MAILNLMKLIWFNSETFISIGHSNQFETDMLNSFHQSEGQISANLHTYECAMAEVKGHKCALCTHRHRDPAPAAPTGLCWYLGINALIETGAGQFCKCWDIKKATFYYPERLWHKAAFHSSSIWTWLSWNRRGLIISEFNGAFWTDAFLIYTVR